MNTYKKKFIGNFEDMYKNEDMDVDPWLSSDLSTTIKKIHSTMLSDYNYSAILDYGCGKGAFTHTLKKKNNKVYGVDVSIYAIKKAKHMYKHLVDFSTIVEKKWKKKKYDLIVCLETLSYVKQYKQLMQTFSTRGNYLYLSLYIPKKPIGFVKNIDKLISQLESSNLSQNKVLFLEQEFEQTDNRRPCTSCTHVVK